MSAISAEEHHAVMALLAATKMLKDDEDVPGFAACWAREARLSIHSNGRDMPPLQGRDAIMGFYSQVWKTGGHGLGAERETHIAEPPYVVALEKGRLLARHAAVFVKWQGDGPVLVGFGEFRDEIIFEEAHGALRCASRGYGVGARPTPDLHLSARVA